MSASASSLIDVYAKALETRYQREEVRAWALLAAGSLAVAGVFALFIALSRVPGLSTSLPWPSDFFHKGLVIHVVFSFVVWFLAIYAMLATLACYRLRPAGQLRLIWAGWVGVVLCLFAFPLLFAPAFFDGAEAVLSNYIPVIEHPAYEYGLIVLFAGILLPVLRLAANLSFGHALRLDDPLPFVTLIAGLILLVAIASFILAHQVAPAGRELSYEQLFWGGGHVLQFFNTLLMIVGWFYLARLAGMNEVFDLDILKLGTIMLLVFSLPAIAFYGLMEPFSETQTLAFTNMQYALGLPVVLVGGAGVLGLMQQEGRKRGLPWSNTIFLCLALALLVFVVGGLQGFVVDGNDTRTPAHYHGVIAGVNLTFMGLVLFFVLPALGRPLASGKAVRRLILMFGFGQLLACIGLFMAGGYGAPRKASADVYVAVDGAVIGLYLNGIGALIAVIGGVMFIWVTLRALLRRPQPA